MKKFINPIYVEALQDVIDNNKFELYPININNVAIKIDKIIIRGVDNKCLLYAADDVDSAYSKIWKADVGGVVKKDIKTKKYDKYYEILTCTTKTLLRLLDDDVVDEYINLKYGILKIADYRYLPIKSVRINATYSSDSEFEDDLIEEKTIKRDNDEENVIKEDDSFMIKFDEDVEFTNNYENE